MSKEYQSPVSGPTERFSTFRAMIRETVETPEYRASTLADANHEIAYKDIAGHIEAIQEFLGRGGVSPSDCLTIELSNSVRGALTILALLDGGFSVVSVPVAGQGARAGGARDSDVPYPRFSRWIVRVRTDRPTAPISHCPPESFLELVRNPHFDPLSSVPEPDDPRLYFRTSGSLSSPKLAEYRHSSFLANALMAMRARGFDTSHRFALPTPIFHVYGLGAGLLAALPGGASIDVQEKSNLLVFFERERKFQPNVAYVTPAFCETLIRARRSPRQYEFMVISGDRVSEGLFKRAEEAHGTMITQYGSTEMGIISACTLDMSYELRSKTVGRTVDGVETRLVPVNGAKDLEGGAGELQVRHPCSFEGYVDTSGNPILREKTFDDGWYRTGDLASMGPSDTLIAHGRCDLSVNRNGVLVPLAEVESRFRDFREVDEVAVALGKETIRGRELVAFCSRARGSRVTGDDLRKRYAESAPKFSVPDKVVLVEELPKLESGKVDRVALAGLAQQH